MKIKKLLINGENAEFQIIESLKMNRSKRAKNREVFIEGIEPIKQALKAGLEITRIITTKKISSWARETIEKKAAADAAPRIIEMSEELYRRLCDRGEPSEMLVTAKIRPLKVDGLTFSENPFILLLDRPSDMGNLGSIIRSANSFNADAILIIGHAADPWDPKTIRASLGSIFFSPPVQLESLEELECLIQKMKSRCGLKVWGTDSAGASSLAAQKPERPILLILGNEARGMSAGLKNLCDTTACIPLSGNVNSLNVAQAAGIFMWEIYRNSGGGV